MKTSLLTIIAAAAILSAACQVQAGMSEIYFPLNVGNSWTYTNGTEDVTFTIIGTEEINGYKYFQFDRYFNIFPPPPGEDPPYIDIVQGPIYFRYDSTGTKVIIRWGSRDGIRYSFTGDDWDPGWGLGDGIGHLKQENLVCNVIAGQFQNCINFQFDKTSLYPPMEDAYGYGEYLAPNIGLIKFVRPGGTYDGLTEGQMAMYQLKSYSVIPEPATLLLIGFGTFCAIWEKRRHNSKEIGGTENGCYKD
jgi:hypothetical protein